MGLMLPITLSTSSNWVELLLLLVGSKLLKFIIFSISFSNDLPDEIIFSRSGLKVFSNSEFKSSIIISEYPIIVFNGILICI